MPVDGGPVDPPTDATPTKGKPPLLAIAAVVIVLLGVVGYLAFSGNDDQEPVSSEAAVTTTSTADTTTTSAADTTTTTDTIDGTGAKRYGDNPQLDALYDDCADGDFAACDQLYAESDFGSEYRDFADTCGELNEPAGYCAELYAEGGG